MVTVKLRFSCLGGPRNHYEGMVGYMVNPRGGFLSIGRSNFKYGICGEAWRVGLGLGPNDLVWIAVNIERLRDRKIPHGVGR